MYDDGYLILYIYIYTYREREREIEGEREREKEREGERERGLSPRFFQRRCVTDVVVVPFVFCVGLKPGRERHSPQERRLCGHFPQRERKRESPGPGFTAGCAAGCSGLLWGALPWVHCWLRCWLQCWAYRGDLSAPSSLWA
jgi:hypothetical protein